MTPGIAALLLGAILLEVVGTTAMALSQQFTRLIPSAITILCYGGAFFILSMVLRYLPVGVVYAIWSGAGVALITLVGAVFLGQRLDLPALLGIGMITGGVVVINLFSTAPPH